MAEIARDEGFLLNPAKTRAMPRSSRQQLCGVVVNEHPAPPPPTAPGTRTSPHLLGRIAWVEQLNPPRGRRLRERFEAIPWAD